MAILTYSLLSALWAFVSAAGLVVLGVLALRGGQSRPRGAIAFSLFAMFWGGQIILSNMAVESSSEATALNLYLLQFAFLLPLPFFLVEFAASQSMRSRGSITWRFLRLGTAGLLLASLVVFILEPYALIQGVVSEGDTFQPTWGALMVPLVSVPLHGALGLTLLTLNRARRVAATPRLAMHATTLLAGLGIYVAFVGGKYALFFGRLLTKGDSWAAATNLNQLLFFGAFLLLATAALAVAVGTAIDSRDSRSAAELRRSRLVVAAMLAPLFWGVLEGYLMLEFLAGFRTEGLWRLAGLSVMAYGLARVWHYDLPQKAARTSAYAAGLAGSVTGGVAVVGIGTIAFPHSLIPAIVAVLGVSASAVPMMQFADRMLSKGREEGVEEALYGQRIETYRAALEASLARGTLNQDQEFLESLRSRFGIGDEEDRILRHLARAAVLVPRGDDADLAYERLRLLGEGGAGRTWLARDRIRDRLVVLKEPLETWQVDDDLRARVLREARLAARVRHPNVVHIEEVLEQGGAPIIVMQHVEGGSLAQLLRREGVLSWQQAVSLTQGVLVGLEAVHAAGILHCDLKPGNILLRSDGTPVLADFGVAVGTQSTDTVIHVDGPQAGTMSYMAPEVRTGTPSTKQSDIYSVAALLHECLYGAPPGAFTVQYQQEDLPGSLLRVLQRAMHEDPVRRFPSARAFAHELAKVGKA